MYLFQISNYDDPAVDRETVELLHQCLEAESRRRTVDWEKLKTTIHFEDPITIINTRTRIIDSLTDIFKFFISKIASL